jgi:hypothetical protein
MNVVNTEIALKPKTNQPSYHHHKQETIMTIKTAKLAAQVSAILDENHKTYSEAFTNWASWAGDMEVRDGSSKITQRMEFEITNELNGVHVRLYGNTTDKTKIPEEKENISRELRFCARLNVAYWENRKAQYLNDNPEVDRGSVEYNEDIAMNDLNWANILVPHQEALLNFNRLLVQYNGLVKLYETITDTEYVYVPYKVRDQAQHSPENQNLAKRLLAG